jgi:hypothetical protein
MPAARLMPLAFGNLVPQIRQHSVGAELRDQFVFSVLPLVVAAVAREAHISVGYSLSFIAFIRATWPFAGQPWLGLLAPQITSRLIAGEARLCFRVVAQLVCVQTVTPAQVRWR